MICGLIIPNAQTHAENMRFDWSVVRLSTDRKPFSLEAMLARVRHMLEGG